MSERPQTIAVIGGINRDEIRAVDGRTRRGWGGILYNVAALREFGSNALTILPIAFLGCDAKRPVGQWLRRLPHVDESGLVRLNRNGNLCRLRYRDDGDREETLLSVVPALRFPHVRPALSADLILMNFISGRDIRLSALERLRSEFDGPIYMDIHSYLLGRHRDGTRFSRRPRNWLRVIACADILQMNEIEFAILAGTPPDPGVVRQWSESVLAPLRCRCLLVTLAARGALCAVRHGRTWDITHCPSKPRPRGADPTGAGDVFAAAWIASWLAHADLIRAAREATKLTGERHVMPI